MAYNFYSSMFSIGSSNASQTTSFYNSLSEYSSIKTGSYRKLLNAYYGVSGTNNSNSQTVNKLMSNVGSNSGLTVVKGSANDLADSAKKLYSKGSDSAFESEDSEEIVDAVKSFVSDYNSLVSAGYDSDSSSILRNTQNLVSDVMAYSKSLENVGITMEYDGTLSIDADKLSEAGIDSLESLFGGVNSLAYDVGSRASQMARDAVNAASYTYGSTGGYSGYNYTSVFDSYL